MKLGQEIFSIGINMIEIYRTIFKQSGDIKYQNVVIMNDYGKFIVENQVFDDDDVYEMPLITLDNIDDAVDYANKN